MSKFDSKSFSRSYSEVDRMIGDLTPLPEVPQEGPHVPDPPLLFADKEFMFVPVPEEVRERHTARVAFIT